MKVKSFFSAKRGELERLQDLDAQVNNFIDRLTEIESKKLAQCFKIINDMADDPLPKIYEIKIQSVSDCPLANGTSRVIIYYSEEIINQIK